MKNKIKEMIKKTKRVEKDIYKDFVLITADRKLLAVSNSAYSLEKALRANFIGKSDWYSIEYLDYIAWGKHNGDIFIPKQRDLIWCRYDKKGNVICR